MKNFLSVIMMVCLISFVVPASAQTFYTRNITEQFKKYTSTTDDVAKRIDSIVVKDGEAGTIEVLAIGYEKNGADIFSSRKTYRYSKTSGTLTLSSYIDSVQTATSALSASELKVVADGNDLRVNVKGVTSKNITWAVTIKQYFYRRD